YWHRHQIKGRIPSNIGSRAAQALLIDQHSTVLLIARDHFQGDDIGTINCIRNTFESQEPFRPHSECLLSENLMIISHPSQTSPSRP
ncbi:MAG: hypothetical protein V7761_04865, partial [Amylibacter sp.]